MNNPNASKKLFIVNGTHPIPNARMKYRITTETKCSAVCCDRRKDTFSKKSGVTVKNQPQKMDPSEFFKNNCPFNNSLPLNSTTELVRITAINAPKKRPMMLLNKKVFIRFSSCSSLRIL